MNDAMQRTSTESPSAVHWSAPSVVAANVNAEMKPNAIVGRSAVFTEPDSRLTMIAEAAYFCAERRGFDPGHEIEDWCTAEAQVDEALGRGTA